MTDMYTDLKQACSRYWNIRNSGERGEARTQSHDDVLSLFDALGIPYNTREEAANIAKDVMNDAVKTSLFVQVLERLIIIQDNILYNDRTHDIIPVKGGSGKKGVKKGVKEVVLVGRFWQGQICCRMSIDQYKRTEKAEQHLRGGRHEN